MSDAELLIVMRSPDEAASNMVVFACPTCSLRNLHPLDERGTRLLTAAGIRVVLGPDPAS
jgi:hypothetical protein